MRSVAKFLKTYYFFCLDFPLPSVSSPSKLSPLPPLKYVNPGDDKMPKDLADFLSLILTTLIPASSNSTVFVSSTASILSQVLQFFPSGIIIMKKMFYYHIICWVKCDSLLWSVFVGELLQGFWFLLKGSPTVILLST